MTESIIRRSIALFCAIAMLFSMLPLLAFAQKANADETESFDPSRLCPITKIYQIPYATKIILNVVWKDWDEYNTGTSSDTTYKPDGANIYLWLADNSEQKIGSIKYSTSTIKWTYSNLTPNTTYRFLVKPYKVVDGKTYEATSSKHWNENYVSVWAISLNTDNVGAPKIVATKLANNKAAITIKTLASLQYSGAGTYQLYKGNKKIKTFNASSASKIKYTYTKKKAGKAKYKVRAVVCGKAYNFSKAVKPGKNEFKIKRSLNPKDYTYATGRFVPTKIYYSGNKLKVNGYALNTRIFKMKLSKITVKVKVDGKKVVSKKVKCKKNIKAYGKKKITLTFAKAKKNADLRNGNLSWMTNVKCSWYSS